MQFKPYPEYQDSGVPWLGKVPRGWEIKKLRHILIRSSERNRPDLPLLSVVREKGVIQRDIANRDENHNFVPDDLSNYKVVQPGQFVINKMKAWQGSYGVSSFDGIVSPAYFVFNVQGVDSHFFHTAIRSKIYIPFFARASDGVRIGQWDLSETRMREIQFLMPPLQEQQQIARFLDWKTAQIDRLIRAKRRLVELLKEQQQALLHQVVTGQIDVRTGQPYPEYQDSGIPWLGKVPRGWKVRRLKFLCRNVTEQTSDKKPEELYLALEHVESWTGRIHPPTGEVVFDSQVKKFQAGDILLGKLRPYLAKVTKPQRSGVCVGEFLVLRVMEKELSPDFLEYKLRSKQIIDLINSSTFGAKMPRADWAFIGNIRFAYPAKEEQQAIVAFLRQASQSIETARRKIRREIELLQEYRTRLIADVVTGKLDVRGVDVPAAETWDKNPIPNPAPDRNPVEPED